MSFEFKPDFDTASWAAREMAEMGKGDEMATPTIRLIAVKRRSFDADAVRVTANNMQDVASWSGGTVGHNGLFISYAVDRGKCKQIQATVGCWVVLSEHGVNIFSDALFKRQFELRDKKDPDAEAERFAKVFQFVRAAMSKQDVATYHGDSQGEMAIVAETTTKAIIELMEGK